MARPGLRYMLKWVKIPYIVDSYGITILTGCEHRWYPGIMCDGIEYCVTGNRTGQRGWLRINNEKTSYGFGDSKGVKFTFGERILRTNHTYTYITKEEYLAEINAVYRNL